MRISNDVPDALEAYLKTYEDIPIEHWNAVHFHRFLVDNLALLMRKTGEETIKGTRIEGGTIKNQTLAILELMKDGFYDPYRVKDKK